MAFILQDEFNGSGSTGGTLPTIVGPNTITRRLQVFTAGSTYTLARVGQRLRADSYPKNCTLAIYSISAGAPSSLLRSETITITGDDWVYVNLDPTLDLISGTQYGIATFEPASGTTSIVFDTSSPGYAGGSRYGYITPANIWVLSSTNLDMYFRTYSEVQEAPKPVNPTPTDIDTGIVLLPTLSWEAG